MAASRLKDVDDRKVHNVVDHKFVNFVDFQGKRVSGQKKELTLRVKKI